MVYFTRLIWWIKATFQQNILNNGKEGTGSGTVMYKEIGKFKFQLIKQLVEVSQKKKVAYRK